MHKIAVLPDFVVNQIAAGEVLENPSSAVKELLENALDAGASRIRIEIEGGGLQKILIEDDGHGMGPEDAMLCLKRHATSKISTAQELETLRTMGFRGEALAALAAVSRIDLKTSDGVVGTQIVGEEKMRPCARNRGTTIEARDLFYNAPARLKFQKSPAACAAACLKVVQTISLSRPDVAFQLFSNGKMTYEAERSDWRTRCESNLGPFAHSVHCVEENMTLFGVLGRPEEAKQTRSGQTLFINQRPIVSPLIAKAVKEGFGTRMTEALFPVFVLFLEIPPHLVDVNVHPQKREVRFRDEEMMFRFVRKAIASAFTMHVPELTPKSWEFSEGPVYVASPSSFDLPEPSASLPLSFLPQSIIRGRPLALLGSYLLIEKESWILVDLKGAEARILYEEMKKGKQASQRLLWPLEIDDEAPEETAERLKQIGFETRVCSKKRLAIDALPARMEESLASEFIRQYNSGRKLAACLTKVCRSRKRPFSLEEAAMVWEKLGQCEDQSYDPLGRTIAAEINEDDLAKRFL